MVGVDFVVIDEIQFCVDFECGYVFIDCLLYVCGLYEMLFLGSDIMCFVIVVLVLGVQFMWCEWFFMFSWVGLKKISWMLSCLVIVSFLVDEVYVIVELIWWQKGGCVVVMGVLLFCMCNVQVVMYQVGEVDFLVVMDVIGMGLNLDICYVVFLGIEKFDGCCYCLLFLYELGQIVGWVGWYIELGIFGVIGDVSFLDEGLIEVIENYCFQLISCLMWCNVNIEYGMVDWLI